MSTSETPPPSHPSSRPAEPAAPRPATPGPATPGPATPGRVDYALAPALRGRILGSGLVAIGVVVVLGVLVGWLTGLPTAFVTGLVVLAGLGVLTLLALVGVRHWVLRLDETGYRVRALRSAQARSARWSDVKDLQATTVDGQRCVVLRLRDGRTTTLPIDVLEGSGTALAQTLRDHLDRGQSYRRLR